jgi:hypothetical protein
MRYKLYYFFLLISGLFNSCRYSLVDKNFPEVNTVRQGEEFRVTLPENHTNQENWLRVDEHYRAVKLTNAVWHGNEKGIDFNFIAERPETDTLVFVLRKYKDTLDRKQIIINVIP